MKAHFGKQIEAARTAKGLTQKALGAAVGLTSTSIYRIESGKQGVEWDTFERIVETLGQPASYYFSSEEPKAFALEVIDSRAAIIGTISIIAARLPKDKLELLMDAAKALLPPSALDVADDLKK